MVTLTQPSSALARRSDKGPTTLWPIFIVAVFCGALIIGCLIIYRRTRHPRSPDFEHVDAEKIHLDTSANVEHDRKPTISSPQALARRPRQTSPERGDPTSPWSATFLTDNIAGTSKLASFDHESTPLPVRASYDSLRIREIPTSPQLDIPDPSLLSPSSAEYIYPPSPALHIPRHRESELPSLNIDTASGSQSPRHPPTRPPRAERPTSLVDLPSPTSPPDVEPSLPPGLYTDQSARALTMLRFSQSSSRPSSMSSIAHDPTPPVTRPPTPDSPVFPVPFVLVTDEMGTLIEFCAGPFQVPLTQLSPDASRTF